jgi:hypothetical protein
MKFRISFSSRSDYLCPVCQGVQGEPAPQNRRYGWNDLPDATRCYAENVLEALIKLWIKRHDTGDLLRSAAQSNASKRLSEEERRIKTLVTKLDEVRAELEASQERAAVYRELQREHPTVTVYNSTVLDDRDKAILAARVAAFDSTEGPRVGDYVRFADGVTRRISWVWPDDIQTSDGGSFYLGEGYMSFSGALYTSVPTETLTLTKETGDASAWFFHHDDWKAHNDVHVRVSVRAWISSAIAPKS